MRPGPVGNVRCSAVIVVLSDREGHQPNTSGNVISGQGPCPGLARATLAGAVPGGLSPESPLRWIVMIPARTPGRRFPCRKTAFLGSMSADDARMGLRCRSRSPARLTGKLMFPLDLRGGTSKNRPPLAHPVRPGSRPSRSPGVPPPSRVRLLALRNRARERGRHHRAIANSLPAAGRTILGSVYRPHVPAHGIHRNPASRKEESREICTKGTQNRNNPCVPPAQATIPDTGFCPKRTPARTIGECPDRPQAF